MASMYHRSTYSSVPGGETSRYPSSRSFSDKDNYSSYIPPRPPPPQPSYLDSPIYHVSTYTSFPEDRHHSHRSFSENNDFSQPTPGSPSMRYSNSSSSSGTSDSSSETGIGSLVVGGVAALFATTSLGFSFRQDAMSKASLRLATAVATATAATAEGVHGTGAAIGSGARATIREANRVAGALSAIPAGGVAVVSAAGTGASSLASGVQRGLSATSSIATSSVTSLSSRMPSFSLFGGSNDSVTANLWSSVADESPIALVDNEGAEEEARREEVEGEPDVRRTSDGILRYFEGGASQRVRTIDEGFFRNFSTLFHQDQVEVASSIFVVGSDSDGASETVADLVEDELGENTTAWRND